MDTSPPELGTQVFAHAAGKDEPDENDWYVLGQIAENYGETATAREDYRRVVKPVDSPVGGSTFLLAQKRLAELGPAPPAPRKAGS